MKRGKAEGRKEEYGNRIMGESGRRIEVGGDTCYPLEGNIIFHLIHEEHYCCTFILIFNCVNCVYSLLFHAHSLKCGPPGLPPVSREVVSSNL